MPTALGSSATQNEMNLVFAWLVSTLRIEILFMTNVSASLIMGIASLLSMLLNLRALNKSNESNYAQTFLIGVIWYAILLSLLHFAV